jgi:hypothetical protein
MRHFFWGLTVAGLFILAARSDSQLNSDHSLNQQISSKPPFSVSVVPNSSFADGQWISMGKASPAPFYVVLTNTTTLPQKVFESWNSWGYQAISFELVTASGQRVVISGKNQDFDKNFPSTFIVPPGEHQVYMVRLNEEDWKVAPELRFANVEPLSVNLTAIYQLAPTPEARRENVWVGRAESKSYHLQLVHSQPL